MELVQAVSLSTAAIPSEVGRAISFLSDQVKQFNTLFPQNPQFNLFHFRLDLDEALLNASEHGCKNRGEENIKIFARFSAETVEISVEDPGLGFAFDDLNLDDDRKLGNIMARGMKKAKGWGLPIIQSVTGGLFWNTRGNRITMLFLR